MMTLCELESITFLSAVSLTIELILTKMQLLANDHIVFVTLGVCLRSLKVRMEKVDNLTGSER